jgi:hypothetical protein
MREIQGETKREGKIPTKEQRDKGTKKEKKWGESPVSQIFLVSLGFPPIFFLSFSSLILCLNLEYDQTRRSERRREGRIRGRDHEHARLNVYCQKSR